MRLFSFDDPVHREATLLLSWYVNGTLEGAERARTDRHVRECVACKGEVEAQTLISQLIRAEDPYPQAAASLARLHARIAQQSLPANRWPAASRLESEPDAIDGMSRIRQWWQRHPWLGIGLMAQFIAVLTLVLLWQRPEPAEFRTLASPSTSTVSRDAVVVIFDSAASQVQISRLLRELDAHIVDGPNSRDAYTLDLPAESQAKALVTLRNIPWVRFAQPAPGTRGTKP